jgi:replicative DNA helicase
MLKTRPEKRSADREAPIGTAPVEAALIGEILLEPKLVLDRVLSLVSQRDFADSDLGKLFAAIVILYRAGKPVSEVAWLCCELQKMDMAPSVKTPAALRKFAGGVVNIANCVFHAEQIAEAGQKRRLKALVGELLEHIDDPRAEAADIIDWATYKLTEARSSEKIATQSIAEIGSAVMDDLERPAEAQPVRIYSGLVDLDAATGPLMGGDVCLVAARPLQGKSSLVNQIAEYNAQAGKRVLIVSLEMTGPEIFKRLACSRAGIDSRQLRAGTLKPEEIERLKDARAQLARLPLEIFDPARANMLQIAAAARHTMATGGLDVICLDYVQLIDPLEHEMKLRRFEQLQSVSRDLKCLAKELRVGLICAAQLNRESDKFDEPRLSHLADSSAFEKDSDEILFISHPVVNGPAGTAEPSAKGAHIIIGKARHAPTGSRIRVLWHPSETRFSSVAAF